MRNGYAHRHLRHGRRGARRRLAFRVTRIFNTGLKDETVWKEASSGDTVAEMCGRYVQTERARAHARKLEMLRRWQSTSPRPETWNLAPTTASLAVRAQPEGLSVEWLTWGLQDGSPGALRPINARIETAAAKPMFRDSWKNRRCLVPADGWYEWRLERGRKQPYYFCRRDAEPVFFAGLWTGETFCLLTAAADGDLRQIHDRRPLTVRNEEAASWIDAMPPTALDAVSHCVPVDEIAFRPVGARVSSTRNDGPDLLLETKDILSSPLQLELVRDDLFENPA